MRQQGIIGALLAGGAGSRMGGDKAGLLLAGASLAQRGIDCLAAVADEVVQIGGTPLEDGSIRYLPDLRPGVGPAGGVETALSYAAGGTVVVLAVDLPLVPEALLREAVERVRRGALIAIPHALGRWHPLCGAYAGAALAPLAARLDAGVFGLQALADELATPIEAEALSRLGRPEHILLNVNTPADLRAAEDLLRPDDRPGA